MKISITDFKFEFSGHGHYKISYQSPKSSKCFRITTNDMQLVDEFKNTDTNEHTQVRLKKLKALCKA